VGGATDGEVAVGRVVVEAATLRVRVLAVQGPGFRGLHCHVDLEKGGRCVEGLAGRQWRVRRCGSAAGRVGARWSVTGGGGAR
jgi:hypothetical protein